MWPPNFLNFQWVRLVLVEPVALESCNVSNEAQVITIDGPSGAGKGTVASILANKLGWKLLDSGALYRLLAYAAGNHGIEYGNEDGLQALAAHLDVQFVAATPGQSQKIILEGEDVTSAIRTEAIADGASKVSALPGVREALLQRQREFLEAPGLIADGRDMGTVVFPYAAVKVFLTASAEERARRRFEQLASKGDQVELAQILAEIKKRDERDSNRASAPLRPADDALYIDSTGLSIAEVVKLITSQMDSRMNGLRVA